MMCCDVDALEVGSYVFVAWFEDSLVLSYFYAFYV